MIDALLFVALLVMAPFAWVGWKVVKLCWPILKDREMRRVMYGCLMAALDHMGRMTPAEMERAVQAWLDRGTRDLDGRPARRNSRT